MRRSCLAPSVLAIAILLAACTGSEPEATTTIAFDGPEFASWQEWADWRMYEQGLFEDPVLFCAADAGWDFRSYPNGLSDYDGDASEVQKLVGIWIACSRITGEPMISCLQSGGWTLVIDEARNWNPDVGPDRWTEFKNSEAECQKKIAANIGRPGFAPAELPYYFDALNDAYDCISSLGHEIPPPPSFEEWAATVNDSADHWYPHRLIPQVRYLAVVAACPAPLK